MKDYMKNVTEFHHPLIDHKVSLLCDVNTSPKEFSELVKELATLMMPKSVKYIPSTSKFFKKLK